MAARRSPGRQPAGTQHQTIAAMGTLTLVRHGQASFGSEDYDRLSELGQRQCRRLGEHLCQRGLRFEAVLTGRLKRHAQSYDALAEGLQQRPVPLVWPGLDEYDSEALVRAIHPEPLQRASTPDQVREHFRLLRRALAAWMAGQTQPAGMPTWPQFQAGVVGALDHVRQQHQGEVLIVSSGGPIATAVGHVLGLAPERVIELNLRIRNSALTEFSFSSSRHLLISFNGIPHLETPEHTGWVTHA